MKLKRVSKRVLIILVFNTFLFMFFFAYLFAIQIVDMHDLKKNRKRRNTPAKKRIAAERGNIYDRKLHLLANNESFFQIDADRNLIRNNARKSGVDIKDVYQEIAKQISNNSKNYTQKQIFERLYRDREFTSIFLVDGIKETQMKQIKTNLKEKKIFGLIYTFSFIRRNYQYGQLLKPVLGTTTNKVITNYDDGSKSIQLQGVGGVESFYDTELSGEDGWEKYFATGTPYISDFGDENKKVKHGASLFLTIDIDLQQLLERTLKEKIAEYKAKVAMGLMMDPTSGEILAMTGFMSDSIKGIYKTFKSLPISYQYTPGSTIKPFIMLKALEEQIYSTDSVFDVSDYELGYGNRVIKDHIVVGKPEKKLSFFEVLTYSSNVGVVKIGEKLGEKRVFYTLKSFGFGENYITDMDGSERGVLRELKDWNKYSLNSISFGHEMNVTAVQMATAFSAIANGGDLLRPFIVKRIEGIDGKEQNRGRKVIGKLADAKSLSTIVQMMESVVEKGTAKETNIKGLSIAGKTGTAEEIFRKDGDTPVYSTSFCGFFPSQNPKYVMLIMFEGPALEYSYASISAVPTFKQIVQKMVNSPSIVVSNPQKGDVLTMPSFVGLNIAEAKQLADESGIKHKFILESNNPIVSQQFPSFGAKFDKNLQVNLFVGRTKAKASPSNEKESYVGLSIRGAISKSLADGLNIKVLGSGVVYKQENSDSTRSFITLYAR